MSLFSSTQSPALARAHNSDGETTGKLLSGGLDAGAMQQPKALFGAARMIEEGGSLDDPGNGAD